jgi:hypothetical protein
MQYAHAFAIAQIPGIATLCRTWLAPCGGEAQATPGEVALLSGGQATLTHPCRNACPTRWARSAEAMPVNSTYPAFEEITRHGRFAPSSASAYVERSSHQKWDSNF